MNDNFKSTLALYNRLNDLAVASLLLPVESITSMTQEEFEEYSKICQSLSSLSTRVWKRFLKS